MTAAAPWSVKGIDPKAREVAKDLARRSGLTLGEWLNQKIIEERSPEPVAAAEPPPPPPAPPEGRRLLDSLYEEVTSERWSAEPLRGATLKAPEPPAAHSAPLPAPRRMDDAEVGRLTRLLETVSSRMEAAEHRSTLAISGIDQSVLGVLSRLDDIDRDHVSFTERLGGAIAEVRDAQARVAERVRRMEQEDGSRVEALRSLESALSRVANQIHEGGSRNEAVSGQTREELDSLARRVGRVELAADSAPSAYADAERTRAELDNIVRRVNRVEATADSAPNVFANAGQTREELDGLVRRVTRVEAAADAAPSAFADAEATLGELETLGRRVGRVEAVADAAPDVYAEARQTREDLDGLGRRITRVEAAGEAAQNVFANAGQTRDELDGLVRRVTRVEAAAEAAPNLYADAGQTRDELDGAVRRIARVEAAVDGAPTLFADATQTKQNIEGLSGRMARVETLADAAPKLYAAAGKTREDLEAVVRRVARVESATDAAPAAYADAVHVREELDGVARRLARMEASSESAASAFADAEKVETVLSRMAERLERAEARTTAAVQSLESSFAGLDARLRTAESRLGRDGQSGVEFDRRFQHLAAELSQKVEATRAEFAQRLRTAADGRLDRMETTLKDLAGQVDQAEKRSAQAIDHVGREVVSIAQSLGERLTTVEDRTAAAVEAVGGEIARITEVMEGRLRTTDSVHAEALQRLGSEIARIADGLGDRISTAERRSAEALDVMNDKLVRIGDGVAEQQSRASTELSERIRQSEARTAKLIGEARSKLDFAAAEPATTAAEPAAPVALQAAPSARIFAPDAHASAEPAPAVSAPKFSGPEPIVAEDPEVTRAGPFPVAPVLEASPFEAPAHEAAAHDEPEVVQALEPAPSAETAPTTAHDAFAEVPEPPAFEHHPFETRSEPFDAEPFDAGDAFAPLAGAPPTIEPEPPAEVEPQPEGFSVRDFATAEATAPLSTRDMIQAARVAARQSTGGARNTGPVGAVQVPPLDPDGKPSRPFGITFPGRRKKEGAGGPTLRTIFLASGWAAAITTAAIGAYSLSNGHESPRRPDKPQIAETPDAPTAATPDAGNPDLAVALAPSLGSSTGAAGDAGAAPAMRGLYDDGVKRIEAGDASGLRPLRRAANLGYAPAQFYLGRLFDAGGAGLSKDMDQARLWTERAANGGDPAAMYNLASYYYSGEGGPKDAGVAADWFRKAAEHGVVNGQYNLAQLYEKGYGVPQSTTEAYKWYLVAADFGDSEARTGADTLKRELPTDAAVATERTASTLYGQISGAMRTAAAGPGLR